MKTSDLPKFEPAMSIDDGYLEAEPSDFAVIEDSTLCGFREPYLWDMVDAIDESFFKIEIHVYDNYHDQ